MTDADWISTNVIYNSTPQPRLQSVIQYNKGWLTEEVRKTGAVYLHPTIMATPGHIIHTMIADIARKLGVEPDSLKRAN